MRAYQVAAVAALAATVGTPAGAQAPSDALSDETQQCVACHEQYTPGIVADWRASRHARVTPAVALEKPPLERRVSATQIPEDLREVVVGCYECHGRNLSAHKDAFDHMGTRISVVVSPNDCKTCHPTEVEQYSGSKKAHAVHNLDRNPVYTMLVETLLGARTVKGDRLAAHKASAHTRGASCYACHGTMVTVRGLKKVQSALGEVEVPDLANWPNQGVGRVNPDGTLGSCSACHARHAFSLEVARKPFTCAQCHLEPDVPAFDVYRESKHGNLFLSSQGDANWDAVPWSPGKDFRAPTCATCHNSLLAGPDGTPIAQRTHDFGARMWVRLFGLPYSHPQPKDGRTYRIKNKDGQPLPTTFTGVPASGFLIGKAEQAKRRGEMVGVCRSCHSTAWAEGHFRRLDGAIAETDRMTLAATQLQLKAWGRGLANRKNPFDEGIEQHWVRQWLFYGNSVRYAAAMGGPDYASFKNGWWALNTNLQEMHEALRPAK